MDDQTCLIEITAWDLGLFEPNWFRTFGVDGRVRLDPNLIPLNIIINLILSSEVGNIGPLPPVPPLQNCFNFVYLSFA